MKMPAQGGSILKAQLDGWERAKQEARNGHPYATLCFHCFGRHDPPYDEICPRDPYKPDMGTT